MEYIFYKLVCIDGSTDDTYIGSTNDLFKRQYKCKHCVKDVTKLDKKHSIMRLHGGFDNWKWIILETVLYALELHSHIREQQLIDLHQPTLNTKRAYATLEQKNAVQKKYDDANRDTINAKRRASRAAKKALLLQPVLSEVDELIDDQSVAF